MRRMLICIAVCLLPVSTQASEQSNLQIVADHFLSNESMERFRPRLMRAIVKPYQDLLQQNAVHQLDVERFAEMLPSEIADGRLAQMRVAFLEDCYSTLAPQKLAFLAGLIERKPSKRAYAPGREDELRASMDIALELTRCTQSSQSQFEYWYESDALLPEHYNADVARILATPGIARFPNRITKQNILAMFQ